MPSVPYTLQIPADCECAGVVGTWCHLKARANCDDTSLGELLERDRLLGLGAGLAHFAGVNWCVGLLLCAVRRAAAVRRPAVHSAHLHLPPHALIRAFKQNSHPSALPADHGAVQASVGHNCRTLGHSSLLFRRRHWYFFGAPRLLKAARPPPSHPTPPNALKRAPARQLYSLVNYIVSSVVANWRAGRLLRRTQAHAVTL